MDALTRFGLVAVTAMLVFYALEDRSRLFILAFATACGLAALYGFLQGARPFGRRRGDLGRGRRLAMAGADGSLKNRAPLTAWQRQLLHCDRLLTQDWHRVAPGRALKAAKNLTLESLKGAGYGQNLRRADAGHRR